MVADNKSRRVFFVTVASVYCVFASAALPPLEREVSLTFKNEKIAVVLSKIESQAGVIFSYQPSVISQVSDVTASLNRKTVREAIALLFGNRLTCTSRHNHIILKQKPEATQTKKAAVSGYVYEKQSGQKLANVTIYDPATLQSTTSDRYGYYEITLPPATTTLSVNRAAYQDTTLSIRGDSVSAFKNIAISPLGSADSIDWKNKLRELQAATGTFFRKFGNSITILNVRDSITRDWQVSFLPFVGSNHKMSGNVYNRMSLNVLGGYARGVTTFEAGGLFNLDRENVKGIQLAGLFNIVGDSVQGFQAAGLFNVTDKKVHGFQAAGLLNINGGIASGFQAAGLMNINARVNAFGAAGLMNIAGTSKGAMFAGLANIADTSYGFNGAGLFNASHSGRSVQVAGLFNLASEAEVQVAGLFNVAGTVKKTQIGVLNFCDSTSGVPIGLFSFVKKGQHQFELSADEWFQANASFRSGVKRFYSIVSIGLDPGSAATLWQVGYGIGTSIRIGRKWSADLNLSTHHISKGALLFAPSELYRFHPAIEYAPSAKFAIAFGPTFNFYHTDELMQEYVHTYSHIVPYSTVENSTAGGYNQKAWVGGKISLRFF